MEGRGGGGGDEVEGRQKREILSCLKAEGIISYLNVFYFTCDLCQTKLKMNLF